MISKRASVGGMSRPRQWLLQSRLRRVSSQLLSDLRDARATAVVYYLDNRGSAAIATTLEDVWLADG